MPGPFFFARVTGAVCLRSAPTSRFQSRKSIKFRCFYGPQVAVLPCGKDA